jgi:hypothetical protein
VIAPAAGLLNIQKLARVIVIEDGPEECLCSVASREAWNRAFVFHKPGAVTDLVCSLHPHVSDCTHVQAARATLIELNVAIPAASVGGNDDLSSLDSLPVLPCGPRRKPVSLDSAMEHPLAASIRLRRSGLRLWVDHSRDAVPARVEMPEGVPHPFADQVVGVFYPKPGGCTCGGGTDPSGIVPEYWNPILNTRWVQPTDGVVKCLCGALCPAGHAWGEQQQHDAYVRELSATSQARARSQSTASATRSKWRPPNGCAVWTHAAIAAGGMAMQKVSCARARVMRSPTSSFSMRSPASW